MNRIITILTALLVLFAGYSCTPDEFELGDVDVAPGSLVEGIAYKVEHDANNPNIVYLSSLMGSQYTALWDHPQGRSQDQKVTLRMAFPGTYEVRFGVETRGGIVYGEKTTFTIDDMYTDFISDPLWTLLSGGVGEEKTWYLDLDATEVSRNFVGPLYFYGTDIGWLGNCMKEGGDCWNYNPEFKSSKWLMTAADFGSMTFDLKDGAHVKVEHNTIESRGTEEGTYSMDTDNHTMRLNDASPLHDSGRDGVVVDWGNIKILSLTENYMQLAVLRDPALSGEGACLLVYNFISEDFRDNWVAPNLPDPEPPYEGEPNEDLTTSVTTSKTWKSDLTGPYNWAGLGGNFLNEWTTNESGTPVFATWAPPYDEALLSKISLKLTKSDASGGTYVAVTGDGTELSGSYTIDENNWIDFGQKITFISGMGGWFNFETENNKLRIIRADRDLAGDITLLHLGRFNPDNSSEYMTLALVPAENEGGSEEPTAVELAFDNSKLLFGDLEEKNKLRLEMFNEYGGTKADPPLNPADVVAGQRISVTFTLGGITLKSGAVGSYTAALGAADTDWSSQYWGPGPGDVQVTGNGTYTVYGEVTAFDGALVFVVDIPGLPSDIEDMGTVTATISSVKVL